MERRQSSSNFRPAESNMAHYETAVQHLEEEMNGLTLERLRELANEQARKLQTYRAQVQQLKEEKRQLIMERAEEEAKLQLLERQQQRLATMVENYKRKVQEAHQELT